MQSCCGTTFHRENGHVNAASQDLELVAAVRAGSSAAFEELQSRYSRRLYWRIQAMTRNHEDTEDALQDTFLHAYLALDSFEGRSQFASWLTRIAINSALMVLRKRRRLAEVSFEPPSESGEPTPTIDVRDSALDPEQLYDVRQRSRSALRAVSKLKITLRIPMTTWIEQECSMKEVARTLDLSLATVKARFHRARKQLTRATGLQGRAPRAGSIPGSKRRHMVHDFENRDLDRSVPGSS
jgi:RNA polymerase sigma-70 factor (ECF subfamily)